MPLTPVDWNVAIVGWWNRAIFTPQGVARHLFRLPDDVPTNVEFPINVIAPPRISHGGLTVSVDRNLMNINPVTNDYPGLQRAMEVGDRALEHFPHTPLIAAGFNIRYQGNASDPRLRPLIEATEHRWEPALVAAGLPIQRRNIVITMTWEGGTIQPTVQLDNAGVLMVQLNFERTGSVEDLRAWLQRPIESIRERVEAILTGVMGLERGLLQ